MISCQVLYVTVPYKKGDDVSSPIANSKELTFFSKFSPIFSPTKFI